MELPENLERMIEERDPIRLPSEIEFESKMLHDLETEKCQMRDER